MYALETWYVLYGHGRCRLAEEEYVAVEDVDMGDVFLLEKNIWAWTMSRSWRRIYVAA